MAALDTLHNNPSPCIVANFGPPMCDSFVTNDRFELAACCSFSNTKNKKGHRHHRHPCCIDAYWLRLAARALTFRRCFWRNDRRRLARDRSCHYGLATRNLGKATARAHGIFKRFDHGIIGYTIGFDFA